MFCHLNYQVNKKELRDHFWSGYVKGRWHRFRPPQMIWWKWTFDPPFEPIIQNIVNDMGLQDMNVKPRYSYQFPNTKLPEHLDFDNLIGINLNIMEETTPDIHLRGVCFPYEAALVDVGHVGHSVESVPYNRLILKFAIREPFSKIYNALETRGFIDKDATREVNPDFETYKSEITDFEKKYQSNKYLRNQLSQYDRQGNTINKSEIKFR